MLISFADLKNACLLSDKKIIKRLKEYDKIFFESCFLYNEKIRKTDSIDDYIFDLPATIIDEIIILLNK
jgi:hypothetical protein